MALVSRVWRREVFLDDTWTWPHTWLFPFFSFWSVIQLLTVFLFWYLPFFNATLPPMHQLWEIILHCKHQYVWRHSCNCSCVCDAIGVVFLSVRSFSYYIQQASITCDSLQYLPNWCLCLHVHRIPNIAVTLAVMALLFIMQHCDEHSPYGHFVLKI